LTLPSVDPATFWLVAERRNPHAAARPSPIHLGFLNKILLAFSIFPKHASYHAHIINDFVNLILFRETLSPIISLKYNYKVDESEL
jgi:hypothetical protein